MKNISGYNQRTKGAHMKNNDTRKSDTEIVVVNNFDGQDITKLLAEVVAKRIAEEIKKDTSKCA